MIMAFIRSRITCRWSGWTSIVMAFLLLLMWSCDPDEDLPISKVPSIELVGVSHDTIREFTDVLTLTIMYQDGNGDLGYEEPDKYALFVRDVRLENFDGFFIGPVAPPDSEIAVQGTLDIEFPSLFIFGNGQSEETRFQIKMVDRNQNESNILETDPVIIAKP